MKEDMTRHMIAIAALGLVSLSVAAQETYQSSALAGDDLNGTARYVGMGGAMEALGADLSTMGTNPAGIGLFRKSQAAVSFGFQSIEGNELSFTDASRTKASFDQAGAVATMKTGVDSYLNFGFNYHKSHNMNQLLFVADRLSNASQNKLSYIKYHTGAMTDYNYSQVDHLYDYVLNGIVNDKGEMQEDFYEYYNSSAYETQKQHEGYIADYDFNISGNIHNRVYLGLTVGVKDVNYNSYSLYSEQILNGDDVTNIGTVDIVDSRSISGTGFNLKFGAIFRPVETSPFRIGAYVHTPTWYSLTTSNRTTMYNNLPKECGNYDNMTSSETLDFRLHTPWLFGLSVGHTVGQNFAFGATYEYTDYGTLNNRVIDGESYDPFWDDYREHTSPDRAMNENTKECLKGVSTFRVGAEMRIVPGLSARLGYNYVSPKFSKSGYKDGSIESQGTYYASETDYINWQDTHRITAGLGLAFGNFTADIAYKYSTTKGEYYPFMSYYSNGDRSLDNICDMVKVNDNRHQILMTLGYKF